MTTLLDIYDENENLIGQEQRSVVHTKGLWHKTTHCWLVKEPGMILFQKRSSNLKDNPGKLYTTASGHVDAGETPQQALQREVIEECGVNLDTSKAKLIDKLKYTADFTKTDGTEFHDRAIVEVYLLETDKSLVNFDFQEEELDGIFAVPVKETLDLFKNKEGSVQATGVIKENGKCKEIELTVSLDDFLVLLHETHYEKYGKFLESALDYFEKV